MKKTSNINNNIIQNFENNFDNYNNLIKFKVIKCNKKKNNEKYNQISKIEKVNVSNLMR